MNAYLGTDPYVFLSYSHADKEIAEKIIIGLKQKLCRVWYDEGLTPGESWNDDLAEHLKNAEIVVVLLTKNSINSQYVKAEINYALSKQKKILPVILEDVELPAGLEMMLSSIQYDKLFDENDVEIQLAKIASDLPHSVFATKKIPFFETDEYSFFLEIDKKDKEASFSERHPDRFSIICKNHLTGESKKLFDFEGQFAYDIDYIVTQCKTIDDDYFVGNIQGIHIFNILAQCALEYPLYGPDFELLLIFALRIPEEGFPTLSLIDYQYTHVTQSKPLEGVKVKDSPWASAIDEECRKKLYTPYEN